MKSPGTNSSCRTSRRLRHYSAADKSAAPQLAESGATITVSGQNFEVVFDKQAGALTSWRLRGGQLVSTSLRPDFWRAQIDNDRGRNMLKSQGVWRDAHEGAELRSVTVQEQPDRMRAGQSGDGAAEGGRGMGDGLHRVWDRRCAWSRPTSSRTRAICPSWFAWACRCRCRPVSSASPGWGPARRRPTRDRKDAKFGLYAGTVENQFYADYTETGESGNKVDLRWLALANGKIGLLAIPERPGLLSANALHYGTADMNAGKHAFELPHRDFVTLNLDLKQQGVGGDNSWGAWPHDEFLIPCQEYTLQLSPAAVCRRARPCQTGKVSGCPGSGFGRRLTARLGRA